MGFYEAFENMERFESDNVWTEAAREREMRIAAATGSLHDFATGFDIPGLLDHMDWCVEELGRLQITLAMDMQELKALQATLEASVRRATLSWKERPGEITDPTTGRTNATYTQMLLDEALSQDLAVGKAQSQVQAQERIVAELRAEIEAVQAKFSAARHKVRLLSSLFYFLGEPK